MIIPARYQDASWEQVPANLKAMVEKIRETRRGIYLHGEVGTGKTHVAYGIYKHLQTPQDQGGMGLKAQILNTTELMFDIRKDFDRSAYDKQRWDERLRDYRGVLILDDIGAERLTDFVAETFYFIINSRYNEMLPTIFTSNLPIGELADRIGDRAASRIIELCDIVKLEGEDRRLQIAKARKSTQGV